MPGSALSSRLAGWREIPAANPAKHARNLFLKPRCTPCRGNSETAPHVAHRQVRLSQSRSLPPFFHPPQTSSANPARYRSARGHPATPAFARETPPASSASQSETQDASASAKSESRDTNQQTSGQKSSASREKSKLRWDRSACAAGRKSSHAWQSIRKSSSSSADHSIPPSSGRAHPRSSRLPSPATWPGSSSLAAHPLSYLRPTSNSESTSPSLARTRETNACPPGIGANPAAFATRPYDRLRQIHIHARSRPPPHTGCRRRRRRAPPL